jgi:hypothetical protein
MIKQFNDSKNNLKISLESNHSRNNKSFPIANSSKNSFTSYQTVFHPKINPSKKKSRIALISYKTKTKTSDYSQTLNRHSLTIIDDRPNIFEEISNNKAYIKPIDTDISQNFVNLMNDISVTSKNSVKNLIQDYPEIPNDDEEETFNESIYSKYRF